jgi:light-regulated signal transduction histidine kinase (bacteriophytochrome)
MSIKKLSYDEKIQELENQLIQSASDLEQCQKENEEFIYIASHDLKAPLRKISTFASRLSEKAGNSLNEEGFSYLQRILSNVSQMQFLIDDLSALADIEKDPEFIKCDLNHLIKEVLIKLEEKRTLKNAEIIVEPLPEINANPLQLKEVFYRLIENSVLFQPEGQAAQIKISSRSLESKEKTKFSFPADKEFFKIEISDNGIGFEKEHASDIFKAFKRLHGKSTYPGNGLGLAICKKIISMHKGIIYAESKEHEGSVFTLILPQIHQEFYAHAKSN